MDTSSNADPGPEPKGDKNCAICHGGGFVHPRLSSGKPDYSRAVACRCVKIEKDKEQETRLQKYSNLGALAACNFENISQAGLSGDSANQDLFKVALEAAKKYAADPQGWFILVGPSGSGKTFLAAAIANERIKKGSPVFFQTVPDLLDHLRAAYAPESEMSYDELFTKVCNTPLLILDDFDIKQSKDWAKEKIYQLLNHRFMNELATVITSAIPIEAMDDRTRTRLANPRLSRIYVIEEKASALQQYAWSRGFELQKMMTFQAFDSKRLNLPPDKRQSIGYAYQAAFQFAESPDGWLILVGSNGSGKTHLAAAIVNYRYEAHKPATFVVVPEFLDHLRKTFSPESKVSYDQLFEAVKTAPLLVMDDFGEQSTTPWAQEKLYQVINYRYNARLATVITTCNSLDEIEARISSRMVDPRLSMVINIDAPDYRGDNAGSPGALKKPLRPPKKSRYAES
jgi:DNA replication protein DnaC